MRGAGWLTDTIARRFALLEALAVILTMALALLFNLLGGAWAEEPLIKSKLFSELCAALRIIDAAPAEQRAALARVAMNDPIRSGWYESSSATAAYLSGARSADLSQALDIQSLLHHEVKLLHARSVEQLPEALQTLSEHRPGFMLGTRLQDGSWMVFHTERRVWGPPTAARWAFRVLFLGISVSVITAVAARRFARPIRRLVEAVQQFGHNPNAPPIQESGARELREVIRTFNEMQARIQKFLSHRTMMLAAISHDLRTPLTRMRLRGELIQDARQQANHFRDVDEMQSMVDGAMAFFRDDAVNEPTHSFDLAQLLISIGHIYADQMIDIRYDGPAHCRYSGRMLAIKRAVTNLIENAIKYATPPTVRLYEQASAYVIVIQDDGPGIPEQSLGSVFLPYYRLEKSRNRNTGGIGLGLTVAQSIVQSHGGDIVLSNLQSHSGLEARVTLPLSA